MTQQPASELGPWQVSPLVDSSTLLDDPEGLQERATQDGYLFFRGLLPAEPLLRLRTELLQVIEQHGWRHPFQDDHGDRIDVGAINRVHAEDLRPDIGVSTSAYEDAQRLERLHALPHHPALIKIYRTLFGGADVFVHPRHIARMMTPHQSLVTTPPHQDFPLIQGTTNTWTAWFPLGDCPTDLGGLAVLRGSHRQGYVPIRPAEGAGLIATQLCEGDTDWASTSYACGDVLTFSSHTIHAGMPARSGDRVRLSLDVRYQPSDQVIEEKSLLPHCNLSWPEIYADWQHDDLQYYWKKTGLTLSPWDDRFMQPSRRIC